MKFYTIFLIFIAGFAGSLEAVCVYDESQDRWVDEQTGGDCINAIPTAAPFLSIVPDARSGAMGDAGVALSADANALHKNVARIAFGEKKFQISGTYTPWLQDLNLDDIYMAYLSGYRKLDDLQAVAASIRYFSLGNIDYVDINQQSRGSDRPNEFEVAVGYARKLSDKLSLGATGKFIYSDLASGQRVSGFDIQAGVAGAVDLGLFYQTELKNGNDLALGMSMNNLGSKISYRTDRDQGDFIPATLTLGGAYTLGLDDFNKITFTGEFSKLMVPTPIPRTLDGGSTPNPEYDTDGNGIADYREESFFAGTFGSFGDAPNGLSEELQEVMIHAGVEYSYNDQFAVRGGYFSENQNKGGRRYATMGLGFKYNLLTINMSYLVAIQNNGINAGNPLDRTLRFSVMLSIDE